MGNANSAARARRANGSGAIGDSSGANCRLSASRAYCGRAPGEFGGPPRCQGMPRRIVTGQGGGAPASTVMTLLAAREPPPQRADRIVEPVHHALLQRNDRVVGDVDPLG